MRIDSNGLINFDTPIYLILIFLYYIYACFLPSTSIVSSSPLIPLLKSKRVRKFLSMNKQISKKIQDTKSVISGRDIC